MPGKDYYKILSVERTVTDKELKAAYRRAARKYHPDVNPGNKDAEARFKEVNEAYGVLSDPDKRRKYDKYGDQWEFADHFAQSPPGGQQPRQQGPVWEPRQEAGPEGFRYGGTGGLDSLFDELLRGGRTTGGRTRTQVRGGQDIESRVQVSLEEAYHGSIRTISLQFTEPCSNCGGTGVAGNKRCPVCAGSGMIASIKRLEVRIPAGVTEGSRIRISGKGQPGSGGGPPGDLYLVISVLPHKTFKRVGDDLYVDLGIPLTVAVLGGEVQVPTPKGRLALRIPPETQNGRSFRLARQGMPHLGDTTSGDIVATIKVVLPTGLSPQERDLFERLRSLRPVG